MNFLGTVCGYRLIGTNLFTKKVQRYTHRKRRINKKWAKRYGNKLVPDHGRLYIMGDTIYATNKTCERIIKKLMGGGE